MSHQSSLTEALTRRLHSFPYPTHHLYEMEHSVDVGANQVVMPTTLSIATKIGLRVPNLAPEIEVEETLPSPPPLLVVPVHVAPAVNAHPLAEMEGLSEPKKKKYAKEAWPGKKPVHSLLV